jgi:hypothetical protein
LSATRLAGADESPRRFLTPEQARTPTRSRPSDRLPVEWVQGARFTPDGLELAADRHRPRGQELIPYSDLTEYDMRQGELYLYRRERGGAKMTFTTPFASPNCFPGFYLLITLTGATARVDVSM